MIQHTCGVCKQDFLSPGRRQKFCSLKCGYIGRKQRQPFKEGERPWNYGIHRDLSGGKGQFKKGHSTWNKGKQYLAIREENHPRFKGVVTEKTLRARIEAVSTQKAARDRDGKCLWCEVVEDLHAHHIKTWKKHPDLRYDLNNLITLCRSCHAKVRDKEETYEQFFQQLVNKSVNSVNILSKDNTEPS
jgi:hypothetical protein